jgi:hypothetical protein
MEPEPDTPVPSLELLLWVCAFVLGVVVMLLQVAT